MEILKRIETRRHSKWAWPKAQLGKRDTGTVQHDTARHSKPGPLIGWGRSKHDLGRPIRYRRRACLYSSAQKTCLSLGSS
ncbi:hypothetical protein EUGRSUZ_B03668 [Eucalyptus grandis]|uniref:Uncharacterized protein n=2 Tax=Eucalyptus grandis TaxID=71139 RepID=A0ACC3LX97_EUCGR|nr:hypothetical protein EUGRSUZ_B03668 [Eucalyptus grandis]